MTQIKGHFDGKVIVPSDPSALRPHQTVTITGESADPQHGTAEYIARMMEDHRISDEDAELMRRAIEEDCEQIEPDTNINLD